MKKLILLLLFIPFFSFSQLHHSMVSVQSSSTEKYDINVLQSVGQLSLIGNFSSSKVSVIQGFQQPFIRYINERPIVNQNIISYPNPFYSDLNIEFINNKPKTVRVDIFDISGRFIKSLESKDFDNILNLDLEGLQSSEYIINVKGNGINYSTKVIKK
tara:strand:+ start:163 stop:636 length:474 start_codon:yes stop_codon:yes gene_type:complete